jgi:hypothetical protein
MYGGFEIRAGQPFDAVWYPPLSGDNGQEQRSSKLGSTFWCKETTAGQTSREFRSGVEGKSFSCILASTNVSKLRDVIIVEGQEPVRIDDGGSVFYDGSKRNVAYAQFDKARGVYYIALN